MSRRRTVYPWEPQKPLYLIDSSLPAAEIGLAEAVRVALLTGSGKARLIKALDRWTNHKANRAPEPDARPCTCQTCLARDLAAVLRDSLDHPSRQSRSRVERVMAAWDAVFSNPGPHRA